MLRRSLLLITLFSLAACAAAQPRQPGSAPPPALVLSVVVDQFRYDYLSRHEADFDAGLRRLLDEGAVFTNANYEAMPTVTAVGHSTILSGATPSTSGIAGNTWYARAEGRSVQSITDSNVTPLGGGSGASPHRLQVSTIGDELKVSGRGGKVYGVSLKDRSAILPGGHSADGAFWFDSTSGNFVSSSWYFPALPAWAQAFNAEKRADRYAGQSWEGQQFPATTGPDLYGALDSTAHADQLVLEFALQLLSAEQLGTTAGRTDLLSVSFSAMDYLGHASGPDTQAMGAMVRSIDQKVGELLTIAERQAGVGRVLLVMTADHGVSPVPEENIARKLPGGRYDARAERAAVEAALAATFGEGSYLEGNGEYSIYLNYDPVPGKQIPRQELERVAAETLRQQPHVARVYTRSDLERGLVGSDRIDQRVRNGFSPLNSGDVIVVHDPYWLSGAGGTTHGSPYSYDTHVPLLFWGPDALIRPGRYHQDAAIHDIAPTLATLLGIATPSGASGRVLAEMLP